MKMFSHLASNFVHTMSPQLKKGIFSRQWRLLCAPRLQLTMYSLAGNILTNNFAQTRKIIRRRQNYSSSKAGLQRVKFLPTKGLHRSKPILQMEKSNDRFYSTVICLLVKPLAKIAAIIVGRKMRKRFWALTPEERQRLLCSFRDYAFMNSAVFGAIFMLLCIYYLNHLEETPITKRKVFITFTKEDVAEIAQFQTDVLIEILKDHFISRQDHRVKRVLNVAKRIVNANPVTGTITKNWTIYIINEPLINAFVLPNGHIFVFVGSLGISNTDDQLAIILGHEMAHAVLNHGAEGLSRTSFLDWFLIIGFAVIWCVIPYDILACITTFVFDRGVELLINLPASRKQEWEADHVGLVFAANACYDIREAGVLWRKIAEEQERRKSSLPVWTGTHPDSIKRAEYLDSLLEDAEGWRKANGCPPLPDKKDHKRRS